MKLLPFIVLILFFLVSCQQENNTTYNTHIIKVVEAKGYVVPKDSISEPKIIPAGTPIIVKASAPKVSPTNTNIHIAGIPTVVLAGKPRLCTPGQDTFLLPKSIPFSPKEGMGPLAIPETFIAKDRITKDQNPQNFSSYGKLHGLKHGSIRCMLQDKRGNLWLGTYGGGVARFDGKTFTNFTEKEGLVNNRILSIAEDKNGNLWFGTDGDDGVSKFDGKTFTNFTQKEGLANNSVFSIVEDKSGNLWFGTNGGGVSKFDGKTFTNFTQKEGLANNGVFSILEDKIGNLWFGTKGGGVSKFDGKTFTNFTQKEGLANNDVRSIAEDKNGNLWFGTYGGGVSKFDGKTFTNFTEKEGLTNNDIFSILEDKSGNLWLGTNGGGVSKFDGKTFTNFKEEDGIANNAVWSIAEDKSGNLWLGTEGGGVSKFDGKTFTNFTEKEGLAYNSVFSIAEDKSGNLWLGTDGGGVSKFNGKTFVKFTEKEGLAGNVVLSIAEDKSGNLWFGTFDRGVSKFDGKTFTNYTEKEGLVNNTVRNIVEDKNGNLWFGTIGGGVSKFDGQTFTNFTEKEGLSHNDVRSILEDKNGNLWFGTYGGGVSKYDGNRVDAIERGEKIPLSDQQDLKKINGKLVKSFTHFTEKEGLPNNDVRSILEDKSGNLWFGTNGNGVSKYDGKSFTTSTEKEGLVNNVVTSILGDKSGNLWVGTRFGLSKLTSNKLVEITEKVKLNTITEQDIIFKNYTYTDGFLGMGVNGGKTMLQATDGTIWIAANDRLTAMHPENMPPDTIAPNIQLTTIDLFNENISWINVENKKDSTLILGNGVGISNFEFDGLTKWYSIPENLSLSYDNNYLTFNFIGITMNQPKNVKYQYMLEGIDKNWSALTSKNEAPYGNLPHGTYTFKVKAMNSEGYWSKPFEYKFTIRPPFWKTWWFRTLIALLVIGSIVFYIKSRERKLKERQKELEQKIDIATEDIKHQKHIIEEKHQEITDSINYAERIQRSFLATKDLLDSNLNDYFVLFKPKDVVSGDFYWAASTTLSHPISGEQNQLFYLCTADSTGHGVPGAIMSLLNITSIEKAIEHHDQPSGILNSTRKTIIERLKKDGSTEGGKDGMDCSLTVYDFKNKKLSLAAANNPVWIVRGSETIEIKPDKMPVGKHDKDHVPFTQQEIQLQSGDVVYTLTDGFPDQFGGPNGKKFMSKNLRELLASNAHLPMARQKELLESAFKNWIGNLEQIDDVTVIGVRVQ